MKPENLSKLKEEDTKYRVDLIAKGLKKDEGIKLVDLEKELGISANTIRRRANRIGAIATFYPGGVKTAYIVNPEFNKQDS